ncbi:hypothetical protein GQ44DRAFT_728288 [Phaeosphaeriaceae sp. PMI808]|nr:hypothetical protein GQ44DRAFT_728288 [Phaeosphaeriaceae sp. PMI808]
MANAEGSSSVNPLHIEHVDDPEMTWASTQLHRPPTSKTTANIELSAQENSARGTTLTQTQGESVLEPQLPRHQQDVGRSKVNDVQVDTSVEEKPSCLPIGDVADSERERTTSCGATKNIIFHSGIVNEVPDSATQTPHPKKVEVSDALSPLKKPRIVKRAMSPPQWKTFNVQQSHRSEKGHARPLDHDQALGMSLRSVEAPGERNVDREARNNPIPNSGHHVEVQRNVVNELLPIRALPKDNHPTMNSSVLTSMGPPRTVPTPTPLPVLGSFSAPGIAPQTSQLPTPIIHVALSNHKFDNRDNSHIRIDSELAEHSDDLGKSIHTSTKLWKNVVTCANRMRSSPN